MKKIRLGVNLDHVATLRQVRGDTTDYPDLLYYVKEAEKAGADQITIHLREDRRHIQDKDVQNVTKKAKVDVNLEMAVTAEMQKKALKYKPQFVCLVPEKREELTTEGGLDVFKKQKQIQKLIQNLSRKNIQVSSFIAPSLKQVKASSEAGCFAVEFHTGHWVLMKGDQKKKEWQRLVKAARYAYSLGMKVHAGHGLDFKTTPKIMKLPHLKEVNIGHFLVCDGLKKGLGSSIREMKRILKK